MSIISQDDNFFHLFYQKCDFKTLHNIRSFLFRPEVGTFAELKLQTENLLIKLKKQSKVPTSQLDANTSSSVSVGATETRPFWCLFGVCSSDDSCKQTSLTPTKHTRKHQRAHAETRQQAVAPPGGNKDFYSRDRCRNPSAWK